MTRRAAKNLAASTATLAGAALLWLYLDDIVFRAGLGAYDPLVRVCLFFAALSALEAALQRLRKPDAPHPIEESRP